MKVFSQSIFALLFLNLVGCSNWQLVHRSDFPEIKKERPFIKVALTDGSLYEINNYSIKTDSLVVFTSEKSSCTDKRSAIPLDKVTTIKKQINDPRKTLLLKIVSIVGFFTIIGAS